MMRTFMEQSRDVRNNRRIIEHVQKQRVVVQNIEDARVITFNIGSPRVRDFAFLKRSSPRNRAVEGFHEPRDKVLSQETIQHEVAVVIKEEAFCLSGFGFFRHASPESRIVSINGQ